MRWVKILSIILGSMWFFPVSCITGLFVGTLVIAKLDERQVAKGEKVHSRFTVVAEPGENGRPFRSIPLREFPDFEASPGGSLNWFYCDTCQNVSFYMKGPNGKMDTGSSDISYQVVEESKTEQIIEVVETDHDGDNTVWSRYRATHTEVMPLASRMFYFGYMFGALPYAFGTALVLYGVGRFLRRRVRARAS